MPPPRAAISSYVAPLLRSSNSSTRVPPKTGCVCASTNPGRTTRPSASTTSVSLSINDSISSLLPTRSINSSRTNIPPFAMMPSSRSSVPTRGRAGPASVTSCEQLTTASVLLFLSDDINRDADSVRYQHCDDNLQRKRQGTSDFSDWNNRKANIDQSDNEARRTRDLEPPRRSDTKCFHPKQRNRKQNEVRQCVENAAGIVDQLKRFLRMHARQAKHSEHQRHRAHKQDRVNRCLVLRMQAT